MPNEQTDSQPADSDPQKSLFSHINSLNFLGLLRGVLERGLLEELRTTSTPAKAAAALNMSEDLVVDICHILEAYGVVISEDGTYRLQDQWATLSHPDNPRPLSNLLNSAFVQSKLLERIGSQESVYWKADPSERLAIARGVSAASNTASPESSTRIKSMNRDYFPEVDRVLSRGGRYLELGCGIGGRLISTLRAYPEMTAVGIELSGDLLEEARGAIETLGLGARVTLHEGDAAAFESDQIFDVVYWSQFFFPIKSRQGALQVAYKVLKSGGHLMAPLPATGAYAPDDTHTEGGKGALLSWIIFRAWEIPPSSAQDLQGEMEEAGFVSPRVVERENGRLTVIAQRP